MVLISVISLDAGVLKIWKTMVGLYLGQLTEKVMLGIMSVWSLRQADRFMSALLMSLS